MLAGEKEKQKRKWCERKPRTLGSNHFFFFIFNHFSFFFDIMKKRKWADDNAGCALGAMATLRFTHLQPRANAIEKRKRKAKVTCTKQLFPFGLLVSIGLPNYHFGPMEEEIIHKKKKIKEYIFPHTQKEGGAIKITKQERDSPAAGSPLSQLACLSFLYITSWRY